MATLHDDDDDDQVAATQANEGAEVEVEGEEGEQQQPEIEVVEDDGQDERPNQEESGEEQEERPHRQKESAAERRQRAKQAKERDKRELDFQRRELARQDALIKELQKGQIVSRVTDLDDRITTALAEAETYDQIFGKAITAKNGDDARAAAAIRDAAKQRAWEADQEKRRIVQQAQVQPATPPPYQSMAEDFMAANPWYDHSGRDADSRLVKEIDAQVAKDFVPTSPAYWAELQRRVNKNLPQRAQQRNRDDSDDEGETQVQQSQQRTRKGPPTGGSSRSNSSTSNGTQIRLSPERVAAMKDAGLWDDPKTRAKMAKQYANYDKANSNG